MQHFDSKGHFRDMRLLLVILSAAFVTACWNPTSFRCDPILGTDCPAVDAGDEGGGVGGGQASGGTGGGETGGGTAGGEAGGGAGGGALTAQDLALFADRDTLFIGTQDAVNVKARWTGEFPLVDQEIQFKTTSGLLRNVFDGGLATTLTTRTDSLGYASTELVEAPNQSTEVATITATHTLTATSVNTPVKMVNVTRIVHVETRCGTSIDCKLMGARTSGYHETAEVTFRVEQGSGAVGAGIPVQFSLWPPSSGAALEAARGMTDTDGEVTVSVQSGFELETFAIHAIVFPGELEASSPMIAIRAAKPANKGTVLYCDTANVPAYKSTQPPLLVSVNCTVRLVDRNNNPVGTGVDVLLKTEAGAVPNSVTTAPYTNNNADEGLGRFQFLSAGGTWPPVSTTPFVAKPFQFPFSRGEEPFRFEGPLQRNPRDGLITVMAYTVGEEDFADTNNNGVYDLGESFVDQGEPFVDWNDNNICDEGEEVTMVDENNNGICDPPNGVYDRNRIIWTETKILASNSAEPLAATLAGNVPGLCASGNGIPKGGFAEFEVYFPDSNLNRVQAGSILSFSRQGNRGGVEWRPGNMVSDGYGFEYQRVLIDQTDETQPCKDVSERCEWRSVFGTWGRGWLATLRVNGVSPTDASSCADEAGLTARVSVLSSEVTTPSLIFGVQ